MKPPQRAGGRRRAPAPAQLLLAVCLALAGAQLEPFVGEALAMMSARSSVANNTFSTRSLTPPGGLTASAHDHDVGLNWSAGGSGEGYAINGVANGSSDCTGAVFAGLGASTNLTYTDAGRYAPQGTWFCYQVQTTAGSWTSLGANPTTAVQLGFVARSVSLINAGDISGCGGQQSGVAGDLDCGDQVVVGFNQAVDPSSGPASGDTLCAYDGMGTLWLGSAITIGACSATEAVSLGKLTGSTLGQCDCRFAARYGWSADHQTLTVTVGARLAGTGYPSLGAGPWTFTPTTDGARLLSGMGAVHLCDNNAAGGHCLPSTP